MHYTYRTSGTCSTKIDFEINDSIYWEDPHTPHLQSYQYVASFIEEG